MLSCNYPIYPWPVAESKTVPQGWQRGNAEMTAWPLTQLPKFDVTFPWRGSNFVPFNMMDMRTPDSARLEVRNHSSPLALSPRRPLSWTSTWQTMSSRKGNGDWKSALCNWLCTEISVLPFLLQKHRAQDASSRYKVQVNSNVYF